MKTRLIIFALFACFAGWLGAADVVFNLGDFTTSTITNRQVKIEPQSTPRSGGASNVITRDSLIRYSDTNGSLTVTNMSYGNYLVTLLGPYAKTEFRILVPETNVTLYADALLVTTNSVPSESAGYSQTQANRRFVLRNSGWASNLTVTNLVLPVGATDGYVWTASGTSGAGAWVASGGVGSGEANVLGIAGLTNATRFGIPHSKSGVTNVTRTLQPGYGSAITNEGTNLVLAVDAAVIPSHTQLGTASNAVVTMLVANDTTTSNGVLTAAQSYAMTASNNAISALNATLKPYATNIGALPSIYTNVLYVNATNNGSASLFAAKTAAIAAGITTIVVGPGTYTNGVTNLFWNGHWHFLNATLRLADVPTNTSGSGIFDDRFSGAVTGRITGALTIEYNSGTNVFVDPDTCIAGYNTNAHGAIVVTNGSLVRWEADTVVRMAGHTVSPFVIYLKRVGIGSVFRRFTGSLLYTNEVITSTNCPAAPGEPISLGLPFYSFLFWGTGNAEVEYDTLTGLNPYTLSAYSPPGDVTDLVLRGKFSDAKIYLVGNNSPEWKVWAEFDEIQNQFGGTEGVIDCFDSGRYYFYGKKIMENTAAGAAISVGVPPSSGASNLVVWVDIQKVAGSNTYVRATHGEVRGRIGHMELTGPAAGGSGILATNAGKVFLSGENLDHSLTAVSAGGNGVVELTGFTIQTTNRDPVHVSSGADVTLNAVKLRTVSGTNAIRAPSAATVKLNAVQTDKPLHVNVTAAPGISEFGGVRATTNFAAQFHLYGGQTANRVLKLDGSTNVATADMRLAESFSGASDGQGLIYHSASGTWTNGTVGGSGEVNVNGEASVTNNAVGRFGLVNSKAGVTNLLRSVQAGYGMGGTNEGTNIVFAVTDAELIEWSGISTNKVAFTNSPFIDKRQGGDAVLTNLVGTVANNVTNENSSALQINTGTLTLTPGILSNLVASGHGASYIAVNTNSGTLNNITNLVFRTPNVTVSNDSSGIASIHVASGGSGGTNFPPVINQLGSTNLAVDVGVRKAATITTNASFAFNLSGTPANGMTFLLGISNNAASAIYMTTFVASASSSAFFPANASNVTVFAIPATSIRWLEFLSETNFNLGTARWNIIRDQGKEMELTAGPGVVFATNSAGTYITNTVSTVLQNLSGTGAVTNENSTALQINSGTLTLTPGNVSNLVNNTTIDFKPGNQITNVIAIKEQIWTNYVQTVSNFVFSFNTNYVELKNQTNVVFTNIVEEATAIHGKIVVHVHNTTGVTMGLVWPAYGAQHGYFFGTNINNAIISSTSLTTGKHGVASIECFGTNFFATWTEWP